MADRRADRGKGRPIRSGARLRSDYIDQRPHLHGQVAGRALRLVRLAQRPVSVSDLLGGLVGKGRVDDVQQPSVLPEAEAECHADDGQRHEQPRPQLVEVTDERQLLIVADAAQRRAQRT